MKLFTYALLLTLLITQLNCANQKTPTGGPKDSIPPALLQSFPSSGTTNFKGNTITLIFDDKIGSQQLKNTLIISPTTDLTYDITTKQNKTRLILNEPLLDSTTYTFNFLDGITDLTERNPVVNLRVAFSTGPYIDSLFVNGKVSDLYNQSPQAFMYVGLYPQTDSLDLLKDKPLYFSQTDSSGCYSLENIKPGHYKIFAFKDENKNFLFDPSTETYGFISEPKILSVGLDSMNITSNSIDSSPLRTLTAKPFGHYFDIRYSKPITNYNFIYLSDHTNSHYTQLINEYNTLRFYNNDTAHPPTDSVGIMVIAYDTIGQTTSDTLYLKFITSNKPTPPINATGSITKLTPTYVEALIIFSKPIKHFNNNLITVYADSLLNEFPIDSLATFHWNQQMTELTLRYTIPWTTLNDTLNNILQQRHILDTLLPASTVLNKIYLSFDTTAFITVENDSVVISPLSLRRTSTEDYGTLHIKLNTFKTSFTLQLLNDKEQVVSTVLNESETTFSYLQPGSYHLRILIDDNLDGQWGPGNLINNTQPETIVLFPSLTKVLANWEINIDNLSF